MDKQKTMQAAHDCNLGLVEHGMWIAFQAYQERLVEFAQKIRVAALEEAAQIVDGEALTATDNFEDEAVNCAIFSASEKVRALKDAAMQAGQ